MKRTYILNSNLILQFVICLSTYTVFILLLMFAYHVSANELSENIFNAQTLDKIGYKETKHLNIVVAVVIDMKEIYRPTSTTRELNHSTR